MVNDLLPIEDERITYDSVTAGTAKEGTGETTTKMDVLLNDKDEVWVELKGKHIADVIQTLSTRIKEICNSSTGSALGGSAKASGKALSVNQMAKALKALPEYREIMSKLSQHMQIAHQCMDAFNKKGLLDLQDLEQTLATGKTDEERTPKLKQLLGKVVEEFRKQPVSAMRLRLLAIVIVSQRGLPSQSYLEMLLNEAKLSDKQLATLKNFENIGCPLVQEDKKVKHVKNVVAKAYFSSAGESDSEYSDRYVCLLKTILQDATSGNLCVEEYPSVMPMPDENALNQSAQSKVTSVRKGSKSAWGGSTTTATGVPGKKKAGSGSRQLVFVAGGMCYSELRTAREVMTSSGTEIIAGATRCITPSDFLHDLARMS